VREKSKGGGDATKILQTYSPKDRISHSVFGLGTVVEIDERYTKIDFDESGTRKFVTSMVELEPSDTPAPAKSPGKKKPAKKKTAKKKTAG
jgi:hypothetical protein